MQYIWKLFRWNNGVERTEFTNYLVAPVFLELRCNEQLSSGQVSLENMPTSQYRNPLPPKTKLTLERWMNEKLDTYYDYMVDRDEVEHYAGCPEVCCHRIQLIEASVYAQGLNCDNFALTYELNDVTLNYRTIVPSGGESIVESKPIIGSGYERPDQHSGWSYNSTASYSPPSTGYMNTTLSNYIMKYTNSFQYRWKGLDAISDITYNLNGLVPHEISFTMPIVECFANTGTAVAEKLFDCPTRCEITRTTLRNGLPVEGSTVSVKSQLYNPINIQDRNDRIMYNGGGLAGLRTTKTGTYEFSYGSGRNVIKIFFEQEISNFPAMINTNNTSNHSRKVTFSTTKLTMQDFDNQLSHQYKICLTIEPYQSGALVQQYTMQCVSEFKKGNIFFNSSLTNTTSTLAIETPNASVCYASLDFFCRDTTEPAPSNPFLKKGREYNCFDLFRRAMLTCDTQIINNNVLGLDEKYDSDKRDIGIQYPIEVSTVPIDWMGRMKDTIMFESVFENKNLWEVLVQIGYYLHAIPYLEFAHNGKERFVLKFKQLGGTEINNRPNNKITVFNSQTLDNFFTQYDSYVTNLFSPQNEIDEWLVCKTSDVNYLVSNDTAELHTKYNISELLQFDIIYETKVDGVIKREIAAALEYVFEKSVYDTLSSKMDFIPAKFSALFFKMGTNMIQGLNYVPPSANGGKLYALKTIFGKLFKNGVTDMNLKFNELIFHVRYKTQDTLRITQLRPDLERFIKCSEYEKYPHHEQFYNAQDKIVDSERFSANLWGRLIRVANGIYQCQEYSTYTQEKIPGQLVEINKDAYYVTETENEYYGDAIFQKVTYSKNFNQLSNIVTIPSEPRFFEISERSMIRREVRLLEFIKLSTLNKEIIAPSKFINMNKWHGFIRDLLFADSGNPQLPNFAYTNFKGDALRQHYNLENNDISILFPKSDVKMEEGLAQPQPSKGNTAVIVPLLHFPLRNAIVFEWDMDDNFKAADCVDIKTEGKAAIADEAYYSLQPVRYCDVYGRADLFDFKLFYKDDWTNEQMQRLPFAEEDDFKPTEEQSTILLPNNLSIGLDKDNREALSFNYQLNLLHSSHETDTEDFVTFPNLFGEKNGRLKVALLRNIVSMFDEAVKIDTITTVADEVQYSFTNITNGIRIDFETPASVDLSEVKSIVFYDTSGNVKYAHLAKNVAHLEPKDKLQKSWYIYHTFS